MGTKSTPGAFDCYANAHEDEPMFVLLARDKSASYLVRVWADIRMNDIRVGSRPASDLPMVEEARRSADAMDFYRQKHLGYKK